MARRTAQFEHSNGGVIASNSLDQEGSVNVLSGSMFSAGEFGQHMRQRDEKELIRFISAIYAMLICSTVWTHGMMRIFLSKTLGATTCPHGNPADSSRNWKQMERT